MAAERGVISYPIPLYSNLPIHAEYYEPSQFYITAITTGIQTIITTAVDNNFVVGQEIRLLIPASFGSIQLNNRKGFVLALLSSTQVLTDINSQFADPFILATSRIQSAQILPIGDINGGNINSSGVINQFINITGSFINISPL